MDKARATAKDETIAFEPGRLGPDLNEKKVLIVEDDYFSQKLFDKIVGDNLTDITPIFAVNFEDATKWLISNHGIQLAIFDIFLEDQRTGLDLYRQCMLNDEWRIPIIITSAISERELLELVGPDLPRPIFLKKPFRPEHCATLIKSILNPELKS
ncbi:MAG: hypothetical protein AB7N80_15530 [Bdellovibrionales bacterium]